ncbi:hypothetical protein AAFM48_03630 [Burkholderia pseudomallei]
MSDRPQPLRIAITTGEPAGVGPELTARALADAATRWPDARFTVLGDAGLIAARAAAVGLDWTRMTAAGAVRMSPTRTSPTRMSPSRIARLPRPPRRAS